MPDNTDLAAFTSTEWLAHFKARVKQVVDTATALVNDWHRHEVSARAETGRDQCWMATIHDRRTKEIGEWANDFNLTQTCRRA